MKSTSIIFALSLIISSCTTTPNYSQKVSSPSTYYLLEGKKYTSQEEIFRVLDENAKAKMDELEPTEYFGGSMIINMPSDTILSRPPFMKSTSTGELRTFFLNAFKQQNVAENEEYQPQPIQEDLYNYIKLQD